METVNSITSAASRLVFGDTTKTDEKAGIEPVSGERGNVKEGEPYDKGNEESTSDPKSLAKTTSKEMPSDSTSNLPSTAAHSTPLPEHEKGKEPEKATAVTLPQDEKTDSATQASLKHLEAEAKTGGTSDDKGDGLLSAKKVGEGEGVNTGVKSTSEPLASKEPIAVKDTTNATTSTPAAKSSPSNTPQPRKSESSSEGKGKNEKQKLSLKEKIKAKLHKH